MRAAAAFYCRAQRLRDRPGIDEQRQQDDLRQQRASTSRPSAGAAASAKPGS
jgi:hypothetical protein